MGRILDKEILQRILRGICGEGSDISLWATALDTGSLREADCREGSSNSGMISAQD